LKWTNTFTQYGHSVAEFREGRPLRDLWSLSICPQLPQNDQMLANPVQQADTAGELYGHTTELQNPVRRIRDRSARPAETRNLPSRHSQPSWPNLRLWSRRAQMLSLQKRLVPTIHQCRSSRVGLDNYRTHKSFTSSLRDAVNRRENPVSFPPWAVLVRYSTV